MKFLKTFFVLLITVLLLGILALVLLMKYPTKDPTLSLVPFHSPKLGSLEQLPELKIKVLETGTTKGPYGFAAKGKPITQIVTLTHPAVLIQHPKGTFIIDSGLGTGIDQEVAQSSWIARLMNYQKGTPLVESEGIQDHLGNIDFFLLTHSHWDHVSGMLDFPEVPIRLLPEEIQFMNAPGDIDSRGIFPVHIKAIQSRLQPIPLEDKPYENFEKSLDLFGDGSVVLVSLAGHTPGSLGVFVNQAPDKRFLFVGDAVYLTDEQGRPLGRSLLAELVSDQDRSQARKVRKKLERLLLHSN